MQVMIQPATDILKVWATLSSLSCHSEINKGLSLTNMESVLDAY